MDSTQGGRGAPRTGRPPEKATVRSLAVGAALGLGVVTLSASLSLAEPLGVEAPGVERPGEPPSPPAGAPAPAPADAPEPRAAIVNDPRVRAFLKAYGSLIDSVSFLEDDAVFHMAGAPIHFRDGRMLDGRRAERTAECDPIFYRYPLGPLSEPPPAPAGELPTYCADLMESLWGRTEAEIRRHGRSVTFLDHRMFVNGFVIGALTEVERDVRRQAATDREVAAWIEGLAITYSFISRDIAGSDTPSRHGFGLAVDLVPASYGGRHVYWRWSRVLDRQGWQSIPMSRRWSPPESVVQAFEQHGFVWGGKWSHFDAIHFEYRPEILGYNRLAEGRPDA